MMATVALLAIIIVIESVPVYRYLRAAYEQRPVEGTPVMVGAFALALFVCLAATVVPLKVALRKMEEYEF
jgi:hypothetical protein